MIVCDASAFCELLLRSDVGLAVEDVLAADTAAAPHLLDAEVLHRIVAFGKQGVLDPHEVDTAVADLRDAPIERVDHRLLVVRARQLSAALSGYDALYAALADLAGAPLLTADRALASTARAQFGIAVVDLPGI